MSEKLGLEEVAPKVEEFVQKVVRGCGLDLVVRAEVREDGVHVDVSGEDDEYLFADGARLLYALNHLVNQAFFRLVRRDSAFVVDSSHFRSDRTAELELMARKAAERVKASGIKVVLQPMPSTERRMIHVALAEETGVRTVSEGTGRYRRVLIVPA